MHPRYLIALILPLFAFASGAHGQSDRRLGFDTIFDLPYVQSLELVPGGREIIAVSYTHLTLPTSDLV